MPTRTSAVVATLACLSFAGTIVAPNAKVIVGQVGKNFYGAIYAKSIVVHQDTKVTWVPVLHETVNVVIVAQKRAKINIYKMAISWRITIFVKNFLFED